MQHLMRASSDSICGGGCRVVKREVTKREVKREVTKREVRREVRR